MAAARTPAAASGPRARGAAVGVAAPPPPPPPPPQRALHLSPALRGGWPPRRALAAALRAALRVEPPSEPVPVAEAWRRLEALTAADARGAAAPLLATPAARAALRDSLLVAAAASHAPAAWVHDAEPLPEVLLGVLASDVRLALRALRDYTSTLGLEFVVPTPRGVDAGVALPAMRGPVYIKYNSRTRLCYAAPYAGRDRGVLAQLGGAQVGHLPLGLMDEARERPPPEI